MNSDGAIMDNQPVPEYEEIIENGLPEGMLNLENSMNRSYGSISCHYRLWPWRERNTNSWYDALLFVMLF